MTINIGGVYRNKKHGTNYVVIGLTRHSETLEILVTYEREKPNDRADIPWSRPIELFNEKFERLVDREGYHGIFGHTENI